VSYDILGHRGNLFNDTFSEQVLVDAPG